MAAPWAAIAFGVDPPNLPMTTHEWMELCGDLFQYVIGPALRIWITARIDAKPKRNRTAFKKTSR
jgi:hypothetical protein